MTERLKPATLSEANPGVISPGYDRDSTGPGIVHLGIGAFHRAHQAVLTDEAMGHSGGNWCITGVSMRSATVASQLKPQDCLYSVLSEDGHQQNLRVVGAVKDVLVASQELNSVVGAIADSSTRIITLTITEKGYCVGADGCSLDLTNSTVAADLANPDQPKSAIGILALGLSRRLALDNGPLTLLSCDNLSQNGRVLQAVLGDYVSRVFPHLSPWLKESASFPSSMVDRIVPAVTPAQQARQSALLGLEDASAISTEPFIQWIIEDNFCTDRPDWESAGVQFVSDILPFEAIKLRLLNASHSAIAYCGLLAGKETVDQVMADEHLGEFIRRLMTDELMPLIRVPAGFDLNGYKNQLLARFCNPRLAHRCEQIAMDGSEKIRQRWLPALQAGRSTPRLVQALSAWCYFVLSTELDISDPQKEVLAALRKDLGPNRVKDLLACAHITSAAVSGYDTLSTEIENNMQLIARDGVLGMVAS